MVKYLGLFRIFSSNDTKTKSLNMSFEVSKMLFKSNFSDIIADGKDIHGFATMTKLKKSIFEAKMKSIKKFVN